MTNLAVLGSPITHSRSPRIHRAAYAVLGLDWKYDPIECEGTMLDHLLSNSGPEWRGFSVTMPLKREAYLLSKRHDAVAEQSGVVNTLLHDGDGWAGFNTDVHGLANAITEVGLDASETLVLGSGATAVSAVLAAKHLGAKRVSVSARNSVAVQALARFGAEPAVDGEKPTLLISTLPGSVGRDLVLAPELSGVPLFDVAYDPWPSPLAARWQAAGGEAHTGLGMLVHQALLQVRIFVHGDAATPLENESAVFAAMRAAAQ